MARKLYSFKGMQEALTPVFPKAVAQVNKERTGEWRQRNAKRMRDKRANMSKEQHAAELSKRRKQYFQRQSVLSVQEKALQRAAWQRSRAWQRNRVWLETKHSQEEQSIFA